jgi:hypothetical protein
MKSRIVLSVLASLLATMPAGAQSLTSFKDNFGDHIYYQGFSNPTTGTEGMFQLWPTGPMNINMTALPVSSTAGNPPPLSVGWTAGYDLASFVNARGQHLYYVDNSGDIRHLLVFWNGTKNVITNEDFTAMTGVHSSYGPLSAFSNQRGEHLYTIDATWGNIVHLFWNGSREKVEYLAAWSGTPCVLSGSLAPRTALTSFGDGSTELVYYVGPSGHVCEFAFYNGAEGNYDLTAMSGASPAGDAGQIAGFSDSNGQHVFYVGTNQHVYWLNLSPSGVWKKLDLTAQVGGNLAEWSSYVGNSLTAFSNAWGEQVFYTDVYQHVAKINVTNKTYQDLTAMSSGPVVTQASWCGTPITSISNDDKSGEDVLYVGRDSHVWELHSSNSSSWSSFDLTSMYSGAKTPICFVAQ